MKPRPIIAIDVDDVLAASTESVRLQVNRQLGVELKPEHYQVPGEYWEYYENVWAHHGLKISLDELDSHMDQDQSHMAPHDGAPEALKKLAETYELVVITSRVIVEHSKTALDAGIKVILFGTYGWHHKAPKDMVRCRDWAAVLETLSGTR